jgi:putative serine protease PepD
MMPPDGGNHNFRFYTFPDSNRPHLGLTIQNEKEDKGVQVMRVMPGSPAEKAGVKKGDVITGINDKTVHSSDDLTDALQDHADDEQLNLQVLRNGESKTLQLSLQPARPMINL